jgi:DMSO/TMAO reductase YedYZ molybdopterin-dependent catalytic subunit
MAAHSRGIHRRELGLAVAGGGVLALFGGRYVLAGEAEAEKARATKRADGRPRLPPGQFLLKELRDMGGTAADASVSKFRLKVYGEVEKPFEVDFRELLAMPQTTQLCDVHCVTKWTMLDAAWTGVKVADLAERAKLKPTARHVVFEAHAGYTSNVRIGEALAPNVLIAHKHKDKPLANAHGGPARVLVPDLYFWKSSKWITGIRFVAKDEPGFWETRGYNNHADPWLEERFS